MTTQKNCSDDFEEDPDYTHPHDKMFQQALDHKEAAISLIKNHVDEDIKKLIDFSTVKTEKNSFIEKDFKKHACDVLLSAKIAGSDGYLLILAEHQSKPDYHMSLRLMNYMLKICSMHLKKHPKSKHLPLVYPIVLYNGKAKYNAPLNFWNLFEFPEKTKKLWVENHTLINVHEIPDEDFVKMGEVGMLEFFLKHWHQKNLLPVLEKAKEINLLPQLLKSEEAIKFFEILLQYLLTGIKKNDRMGMINIIETTLEENSMGMYAERFETSIAKHLLDQGFEKGIEKGMSEKTHQIAVNMLKQNFDINIISSVTGLSARDIQKILDSR